MPNAVLKLKEGRREDDGVSDIRQGARLCSFLRPVLKISRFKYGVWFRSAPVLEFRPSTRLIDVSVN